jgi:hypothetical protein
MDGRETDAMVKALVKGDGERVAVGPGRSPRRRLGARLPKVTRAGR